MSVKDEVEQSLMIWADLTDRDRTSCINRFFHARQALDDLLRGQIPFSEYAYILTQLGVAPEYWDISRQNLQERGLWL